MACKGQVQNQQGQVQIRGKQIDKRKKRQGGKGRVWQGECAVQKAARACTLKILGCSI